MINKDEVSTALQQVLYPGYSTDIVSFGIVKDIRIIHSEVVITLDLRIRDDVIIKEVTGNIKQKVQAIDGVRAVSVQIPEPGQNAQNVSKATPLD